MADIHDQFLFDKHIAEVQRMPAVLLGIASAAIGFAFHETKDQPLSLPTILQLLAVVAWAGSFASGVYFSRNTAAAIKQNIARNFAMRAQQAKWTAEAERKYSASNRRAGWIYQAQQICLLVGAVAYLAGHVWGMERKTAEPVLAVVQKSPAAQHSP